MIDVTVNEGGGMVREPRCVVGLVLQIIRSSLLIVQQVLKVLVALVLPYFLHHSQPRIINIAVVDSCAPSFDARSFSRPRLCVDVISLQGHFAKIANIFLYPTFPSLDLILGLSFQLARSLRCVQLFSEGWVV